MLILKSLDQRIQMKRRDHAVAVLYQPDCLLEQDKAMKVHSHHTTLVLHLFPAGIRTTCVVRHTTLEDVLAAANDLTFTRKPPGTLPASEKSLHFFKNVTQ
eukprot:GFUD01008493.1.p2 GENE.GFUD01008493.1~~GFUD01008493.1.p2  ORF type:complete len:101 (-),score=15.27 GFUD01008493.1:81-383(-)